MKLLKIELFKLYDMFNHKIDLKKERITILTAPNGYGKTITLKIIHSLFNKNFTFFIKLFFSKIIFTFEYNCTLKISKDKENNIKFELLQNDKLIESFIYPPKDFSRELKRVPIHILEDLIPDFIKRVGRNEGLNELNGDILEEIINQYSNLLPDNILKRVNFEIPKIFLEFINNFNVYLIQEQRLVLREPIQDFSYKREVVITDTIEKYSKDLSILIKEKIGEYAQTTQSLDSSFPKRLFKHNQNSPNIEELKKKLENLQEKRQKLSKYDFLKSEEEYFFNYNDIEQNDIKVLSLYIEDNEKKLSVFNSLINRIELFTKILNDRRFNFKLIEIDKDKGFIFKTKKNNSILKLNELSSGEQHEVVLLFELLFKAKENSLVLIDEPEISLHVAWQIEFLNDIQEIIKLQKIDIIIATHSPQIINDKWDLTVNLEDFINE